MKKLLLSIFFFSTLLFSNEVTVSILPQKYFVEKIAQDKMNVNVMVKPGASPAVYEPKPSQMRKLVDSKIYFSIGVPFEKVWLTKLASANKNMLMVDTAKGIEKIEMAAHEHHEEESHDEHKDHGHKKHDEHDHGKHDHDEHKDHGHKKHDDHDHGKHDHKKHNDHKDEKHDDHDDHEGHDHSGLDPHIWLDPVLVKQQAKTIYEALAKVDAANKDFYKTNYENFLKELDSLDKEISQILAPHKGKAFMIFHPSWGYFAKRYGVEQIAIEVQGKEPKPAQLIELTKEAKLHNIKIVFVSPQFSQRGAKAISKSINGNVAIMNPLSVKWNENLLKVAKDIANTYK